MRRLLNNTSIGLSFLLPTLFIVIVSLSIISISTFINYQSSTSEIVQDTSKEINKQIILNFENYIADVIDTADYIQQKTIEHGLRDENELLFDIYKQAADVQDDIESIVLIDLSGDEVVTSSSKDISYTDLTKKDWYLDTISDDSIYHFSSPHVQDIFNVSSAQVITVTKLVDYYENNQKETGMLVVDINTSNIIKLTETTNLGDGGHIVIINDDDTLIYTDYDACDDGKCDSIDIAKDIFGGESIEVDDINMYVNVNTLHATRWRMATFINIEIINQATENNLLFLLVAIASTIAVTILISIIISRSISSPINELKNHMQLIEQGDFFETIEIDGQKEVQVLAHSFNSMIEEIRTLMNRVIQEQKAKRRTEFQALQNQINPHFLYNTLDSIVYLSESSKNEKVIEMVVALSKFFRISISRGKNIITLEEELEHARNYLLIQKIRYNEKFDFSFEVDSKVEHFSVVKLSLQPLIENAIYHGISSEEDNGHIVIRAKEEDGFLILEVEDDGFGIDEEEINELYRRIKSDVSGKSVGMRNVYQRLQIYYGERADLQIESELDEKTVVKLIIPKERAI